MSEPMISIPYTQSTLANCIGYKDRYTDKKYSSSEVRSSLAKDALLSITNKTIFQNPLRKINILGKPAYAFNNLKAELTSRLMSKNLKINYKNKQSDRQSIVANTISLLEDGTKYDIFRFDIEGFYENIERKELYEQIETQGKCSKHTLILLKDLFLNFDYHEISGLPRGLGISSTLSEIYLTDFDNIARNINGVFYYARFVDDIILITSGETPKNIVEQELKDALPTSLNFHPSGNKFHYVAVPQAKDEGYWSYSLSYLGYDLKVYDFYDNTDTPHQRRLIKVDISQDKIKKIKLRLAQSFANFTATTASHTDYMLLKNRIRALTGNYTIRDPMSGIKIKTGIYYNYIHKNNFDDCGLSQLDDFYYKLLFGKSTSLSKRISKIIPLEYRRDLAGYSFTSGFSTQRYHSFEYKVLKKIKECWRK